MTDIENMKNFDINFVCPKCGKDSGIEEVMQDVIQSSNLNGLELDGEEISCRYGDVEAEGGFISYYGCKSCGWKIPLLHNDELSLFEWLQEKGMLEEVE
jgi:hypothetical protein